MASPLLPVVAGAAGVALGSASRQKQIMDDLMQRWRQMQGTHPLAERAGQMAQQQPGGSQITQDLMNRLGQFTGQFQPNQLLQQAQRRVQQGIQEPGVWSAAQQLIMQRLAPGYQAFSPQESDALFQRMQQRIAEEFDRQRQATAEDLNRRGLYRTGLYDYHMGELGRQQAEAIQRAATDVYLAAQEATRQAQAQALSAALGLGGQQASLAQQNLANLLGLGQYLQGQQLQAALLPFELGSMVRNMAADDWRTQFQQLLAAANLQHQLAQWPFQAGLSLYQALEPAEARAAEERRTQRQATGDLLGSIFSILPFFLL